MTTDKASVAKLALLRGFALSINQERVPLISSAQRLLAFLALQERPVSRQYIAGRLWPETTTLKANASLRSALWRTQQACRELIEASAQQLSLLSNVVVDAHRAAARAERLLDQHSSCEDALGAATRADLSADLLPDWYEDWVLVKREQYHQLRLHALEAMCERLIAARRFGEAVDAGLAAVRAEPLRESAHAVLIKAHLGAGNRCEAVRQYAYLHRLLIDELGLEPSPALRSLLPGAHAAKISASIARLQHQTPAYTATRHTDRRALSSA